MSNEDMMLAAVLADSTDDTARLVYADAVQERDEALAARIRVGVLCGCMLLQNRTPGIDCGPCEGTGWLRRCQHDGCRNAGRLCVIEGHVSGERDDIEDWFCGEHAAEHGYCPSCGAFWGGISSFETHGICDHCREQVEADADEMTDDEWFEDYDGRYYPDE